MAEIKAGDTVFVQATRGYRADGTGPAPLTPKTVAKVGRRWVTLEGHPRTADRFALLDEDGEKRFEPYPLDGGEYSSPGRVFLSVESAKSFQRAVVAWAELRRLIVGWNPPPGFSADDLEAMVAKLEGGACSDS